ncbi:MAG: hypothetical protein AAF544_02520 [Bacteroidota bacterium]
MSWFTSIRQWQFRRELERELSQAKAHRSKAHNLLTAKRLCVLFPADSSEDRRSLDRFRQRRREEGLSTELFGFIDAKNLPTHSSMKLFGRADLNWSGSPRADFCKLWIQKRCDVLLVLGSPDHQLFNFLTHLKQAELRVGPYSEHAQNPFDVLFAPGSTPDLNAQIKRATDIFQIANAPIPAAV